MRKNLKAVKALNKFILFYIFFLIFGCSYKKFSVSELPAKNVYQGSIWWEITIFTNNETKTISNYADFQARENFLYLRFKSPFNTTLGYGKWEASLFNTIEIFDLYNQKHYLIILKTNPEVKDIPLYFLGLKEKNQTWNFLKTSFNYSFEESKKEGIISSNFLKLRWRFKNISLIKEFTPLLKDASIFKDLQKIEITF